ncbi:ATP-binding protein [Streptomyces sp. ACA25]|uniref:AAA family ATPase n=1 Tax=Streptomyces sp. ACA25 TaxID=3022596 RepID=UPI002306E613|nr:ATP-binding protein [Streptomyces sp. ACA25]MDB1088559.1 ATP-binding protein [Streptomyces sp. ACA25]
MTLSQPESPAPGTPGPASGRRSCGPAALWQVVEERLSASALDGETQALVRDCLGEGPAHGSPFQVPSLYLQSVTVRGFRGIGPAAGLPLAPGPGLTLVIGREGAGKSSFAEGLEAALTGGHAGRRQHWHNRDGGGAPQVAVELLIEGDEAPSTLVRTWSGPEFHESRAELRRPGQEPQPFDLPGWEPALTTYRPFLPCAGLRDLPEGRPGRGCDAVSGALGLGELTAAGKKLLERAGEASDPARRCTGEPLSPPEELTRSDGPGTAPAEAGRRQRARAEAARRWLLDLHAELRTERLRPIAEHAQTIWSTLRQQSSVSLGPVQLDGSATRRRVVLDLPGDGPGSPTAAALSRSELHALAMALALPRALLPDNPFRFVVIDDPVRSRDPAKVDGLARVLSVLALDRQVVVFTHDSRLQQALTYLRFPATVLEVRRHTHSGVRVGEVHSPVTRALEDARAVALDRQVPAEVMNRVLPGLCRTVLEAAFGEAARRRLLRSGLEHAAAERELAQAKRLTPRASLALGRDRPLDRSEVLALLTRECGAWAARLFVTCDKRAHESVPVGDPKRFVDLTQRLAREVRER